MAANPKLLAPKPQRAEPAYGRAALEMLGLLGIGATWYWLDIDRNLADWDRLSWEQRFRLDAIRLDNNQFVINHVAHPVAGGFYYTFARANGLSVEMSALYTLLTSMAWEYGLEFQERTSYNDFIVTPAAGIAVGEAMHALGTYLTSGCNSTLGSALGWVLGMPVALHQSLDNSAPNCTSPRDALGLDARTNHRVELSAGLSRYSAKGQPSSGQALHFATRLLNIDGYGQDSSFATFFRRSEWTELNWQLFVGGQAAGGQFDAHSILVGYHQQLSHNQRLVAFTTGLGLGYRYAVRDLPGWREQSSQMHLPGAYHLTALQWGSWQMTLQARLSPDFSASNSLPRDRVQAAQPDLRGKSVLRKQGYYYGWGWSGAVELEASRGWISMGLSAKTSELTSIQGQDRVQEELEVDERAFDGRGRLVAYLRTELPRTSVARPFAELRWEHISRRSALEGYREAHRAQQVELRLGVEL